MKLEDKTIQFIKQPQNIQRKNGQLQRKIGKSMIIMEDFNISLVVIAMSNKENIKVQKILTTQLTNLNKWMQIKS